MLIPMQNIFKYPTYQMIVESVFIGFKVIPENLFNFTRY